MAKYRVWYDIGSASEELIFDTEGGAEAFLEVIEELATAYEEETGEGTDYGMEEIDG